MADAQKLVGRQGQNVQIGGQHAGNSEDLFEKVI
jgi:hypothetical protein